MAERGIDQGRVTGAPIYDAAEAENAGQEIVIHLPKEIAMKLLMALSPTWTADVKQVL